MKTTITNSKLLCSQKHRSFFLTLIGITFLTSCSEDKQRHITIREPRPLTSLDTQEVNTRPIKPNPTIASYQFAQPELWDSQQATSFRLLNFTFGTSGEVYLSESRGGILPNVNRWLKQFNAKEVVSEQELDPITILGHNGYLVKTSGSFKGMKMTEAKDNYQLLGALVEIDSKLITIKMTGPSSEVLEQESAFKAFCQSLQSNK